MPARPIEVSTFSAIPAYVPFGVLYVTQDTDVLYVGTGVSSPNVNTVGGSGTITVNAQGSGVSAYTAVASDANQLTTMSSASASTFTVPPNSTTPFAIGTVLNVMQLGAGQVLLTPGAGVTISTPSTLAARTQYSTVSVIQTAANTWVASGDLA